MKDRLRLLESKNQELQETIIAQAEEIKVLKVEKRQLEHLLMSEKATRETEIKFQYGQNSNEKNELNKNIDELRDENRSLR